MKKVLLIKSPDAFVDIEYLSSKFNYDISTINYIDQLVDFRNTTIHSNKIIYRSDILLNKINEHFNDEEKIVILELPSFLSHYVSKLLHDNNIKTYFLNPYKKNELISYISGDLFIPKEEEYKREFTMVFTREEIC